MFKIVKHRTFTHDVPILFPIDGGFSEEKLKVTYLYLASDEIKQGSLETPEATDAFLKEVIVKIDDVAEEDGTPIVYSDELRDRLLRFGNVRQAVLRTYLQAMVKVKEGN